MEKIGIFYGTSTGNTEYVAKQLADKLNLSPSALFDISQVDGGQINQFDLLIFGSSTLGYGDLQDDWYDFIEEVKRTDLSGKKVAVFGLGDSSSYPDTFCDAIGLIATVAQKAGATLIGNQVNTSDYLFDDSISVVNDVFCGLPLDEDNEPDRTEERIEKWVNQLQSAF